MEQVKENFKKLAKKEWFRVAIINIIIFAIASMIYFLKYEQVDDMIIYGMYSGLDGTYNIHGVYIHPLICFILSLFFRLIPSINWHTIFLLIVQFVCFTTIGTILMKKYNSKLSRIFIICYFCKYMLYIIFIVNSIHISCSTCNCNIIFYNF